MALHDIEVAIGGYGDDAAVLWLCTDDALRPVDLSGSVFDLRILDLKGAEVLHLNTASDAELSLNAPCGLIVWTPSAEQTALIPRGHGALYSLWRTIGETSAPIVTQAFVIGLGGPHAA